MIENIQLSFQSISAHKMRSILTMLGVIIGIAAIIAIFSIIEGNTANLKQQIIGGSDNTIVIKYDKKENFASSYKNEQSAERERKPAYLPKLVHTDIQQYKQLKGVKSIALSYETVTKVYHQGKKENSTVRAVAPDYFNVKRYLLVDGRKITESDSLNEASVALLEENFYTEMFPKKNGLGKMIEINGQPFKVVGIIRSMNKKQSTSLKEVFVPETTKHLITGLVDPEPSVIVQGENTDEMNAAAEQVAQQLTKLLPDSSYMFGIQNFSDLEESLREMNQSQFFLLTGIASISLLVGGIGVMNIMLVSVTERTKEIGVKKALGARRKLILMQFLIESAALTLLGGFLGVLIGLITGKIITSSMDYPFIISFAAVIGSLFFSVIIGIVFGLLPAVKAARLSPIEALGYE